jgi:glutathione S-transferase
MIEFYTWFTPNGRKVAILLEELGIEYNTHSVNIGKDEQFDPEFLKISPNNKIPAILDTDNNCSRPARSCCISPRSTASSSTPRTAMPIGGRWNG